VDFLGTPRLASAAPATVTRAIGRTKALGEPGRCARSSASEADPRCQLGMLIVKAIRQEMYTVLSAYGHQQLLLTNGA